jgi:hypothetical protein
LIIKCHGKDKKKSYEDNMNNVIKSKSSMKTVGIYTENFRLYHDLVNTLKNRNISYVSLNSIHHIPRQIKVILTSHAELHEINRKNIIAADAYESIDYAIDKALHLLIGKDIYSHVHIGIDPGEKPGIAVVGDDILIHTTQVSSPELVAKYIKRLLNDYPSSEYVIRIGHGSILERNRIINSLIPFHIPIEIVNESKTSSSHQTQRIGRDLKAAYSIALMRGGKVQRRLPLKPTKGEIRRIQEKSRNMTDGKFTISSEAACLVLKGEKSLWEAIKEEEKT